MRALTKPLALPVNFVMGTEELAAPFGTLGSVPRMFVFDRQGKTAAVFYGARTAMAVGSIVVASITTDLSNRAPGSVCSVRQ